MFNLFKKTQPAKPIAKVGSHTQKQSSVSSPSPVVVHLKPKVVAQSTSRTYQQISDLPAFSEVASYSKGEFALRREKDRESIFILKLADTENLFCVIASKEVYGSAAYKGEIERIISKGYRVRHCGVADVQLIARIYSDESAKGVSKEEEIKPIVSALEDLCELAISSNASDIHIEKRAGRAKVYLRINGRLELHSDAWLPAYAMTMARALHTIADDTSKDTTFTMDGQMSVSRTLRNGLKIKLRVQMSPAYPDDSMDTVMRLLRDAATAEVKTMTQLGYSVDHVEMFEYMLSSPHGLVIVAGTTGSGKSTTLQTAMDHIYKSTTGLKLISVEDPPEYVMPGVTQIPVARRRKQTGEENPFIGAMRNTMRMDPDVLMVGEVRDQETAKLLMSMVQSGHKALSTIHTESALGVFARLKSMGLESDVLGARKFISGLIFQTLVPVLCGSCKVEYDPTSDDISHALHERIKSVTKEGDLLFFEAQNTVENPNDCPHCKGRGIVGRTVCAEMVIPNAAILDCIRNNDQDGAYKQWRGLRLGKAADSMIGATALEHAIYKMRRGEVSPRDVEGALGLLNEFDQNSSDIEMEIQQLIGSEK